MANLTKNYQSFIAQSVRSFDCLKKSTQSVSQSVKCTTILDNAKKNIRNFIKNTKNHLLKTTFD